MEKKESKSKTNQVKRPRKNSKKWMPYEIGELDQYLFGQGTHYEIYKKMGAHKVTYKGKEGVYFAVWAPHAKRVSVIGEFNGWNIEANYMERQEPVGIYTCFVPGVDRMAIYISSVLKRRRESICLKPIHLQIMLKCVRERPHG